jgi:AcrR family transcriptional regulator
LDKPVNSLSREHWIDLALRSLPENGIDKITIAGLARELQVTKGSFYWHFKGREDLLQAMLKRWEETGSEVVFREVDRVGGDAVRRLRHMADIIFRRYGDQLDLELALRDWGRKDASILKAVRRADERRLVYMQGLFAEIHTDKKVAEAKAWLLYSLYLGENIIAARAREQGKDDLFWSCVDSLLADVS